MIGIPEERAIKVAKYIIDNKATVRDAGKVFKISKSTAHKDITTRLEKLNPELYTRVREVLDTNKQERHIRGGVATREKYKNMNI
ncbi:MAG: sporulation transcriptional regulator SpoIIID [Clostridia bacterium]